MASRKDYTYQIKGNKLSLLERDQTSGTGLNYVYAGTDGDGVMDGTTSGSISLTSPIESVTDGIEIEYAYSPNYRINDIEDKSTNITGYDESDGLLKFTGSGLSTDAAITYIVVEGSGKWNGLHKIKTLNASYWIVETKYNGAAVTESGVIAYTDISPLVDESSEIDISSYLSKALVYYVKAKVAEDAMNIEAKEYMMREFRKMVEKHESGKIAGSRGVMTGPHSIR